MPRLPLALMLTLLSACTALGPDFREAPPDWLAAWQPDLYGQRAEAPSIDDADPVHWWARFEDPALDGLIEAVIAANPTLQIAALRVLEARARLRGARALRLPQQQLQGQAAYLRQRRSDGLLPASNDSFASYDAAVVAGWEVDFWGRFQRGIEAADAAYLASVAAQRDLQVLLVSQTAQTYYAYRTTQLRIRIAEDNAAIQKRSFDITRRLFEQGQESELDLQQARTQYLATLATIPDLERGLAQTRNALALLLGRPPAPLPELGADEPRELPILAPVEISGVPAQLVLRRPDVRAAAWQAGAQAAQIGIATADLYPALSLFGSFGWSGDSLDVTRNGTTFAIGPSLRWNIFDYGRIRANILLQDARFQQALTAFDASLLTAAREIDDAAIAVVKTAEAASVLGESRDAAARALDIANRRYREGYANFQRVLDAQRALFAQAEKKLVNDGAHVAAIVTLYTALGGGWRSMSLDELIPGDVRDQMRARADWGDLLEGDLVDDLDNAASAGSER